MRSLSLQENVVLPVIQFELSGEKLKLEFWKTCFYSPVLDSFLILKDVFAKANGCDFFIFSKEMCWHLEYLHNLVNQDFLKIMHG